MSKKLTIFENNGGMQYDKAAIKGTEIILKETGTGKPLFRGSNKVIVSGSEFNAIKDFNLDSFACTTDFLSSIPSYDMAFAAANKPMKYYGNNSHPIPSGQTSFAEAVASDTNLGFYLTGAMSEAFGGATFTSANAQRVYQYFSRRVCLWCLGIDGCGVEASRVFKVINTKWIAPYGSQYKHYDDGTGGNNTYSNIETALIPFKYRTSDADLDETYRQQYFGRTLLGNGSVGYFFKAFDEAPALIRRYSDDSAGLDTVTDVWADNRAAEAEVVIQLKMSVSATDCREYFQKLTGINDSKVNTISLCTAVPYVRPQDGSVDKVMDYFDIRPFTKFNFPNESLIDTSKGIDITYYLYY